jgi:uncharacterized OB-fold protein
VAQIAFAPDVFTWPSDEPQLIGTTCAACSATTWPSKSACPRCGSTEMERRLLPRQGTLVAWTTQSFLPKEPYLGGETAETFQPFGIGLVQLDDVVRVETRLTEASPDVLRNGMAMEMVAVPYRTDDDGNEVMIPVFRPV